MIWIFILNRKDRKDMEDKFRGFKNPDQEMLSGALAYVKAYNTGDYQDLIALLADDLNYASQMVLAEMKSKDEFMTYLKGKLKAIYESGNQVTAEIAETRKYRQYSKSEVPCVLLKHGLNEAVVLFEMDKGKIKRIDLCLILVPATVFKSGYRPGLD